MNTKGTYTSLFDQEIRSVFRNAWRITRADPALRGFFWKAVLAQGKAARVRMGWRRKGLQVPPLLICSITTRCNLNCVGCYAHALARAFHRGEQGEMSKEKLESVLSEARELGISIVLLAGGEPLVRKDLMEVTAHYPDIIFPVFTNGLLIDDELIERFQRQRNVVPVISLEGYADDTDQRRGKGIYAHLKKIIGKMEGKGIFLGCSLTVNRDNFDIVLEDAFVQEMIASGSRLFFFVEYVPIQEGTEALLLTETQRLTLRRDDQNDGATVSRLVYLLSGGRSGVWWLSFSRSRVPAHQCRRSGGTLSLCSLFRCQSAATVAARGSPIRFPTANSGKPRQTKRSRRRMCALGQSGVGAIVAAHLRSFPGGRTAIGKIGGEK